MARAEEREWRGGAGVASFLASDRLDVKFATKEVLRDAGEPRADAWARQKRLGRYLLKAPRYVLVFRWQKPTSKIKVTVDASHAGCVRTRKSTTCVVVRLGNHMTQDL